MANTPYVTTVIITPAGTAPINETLALSTIANGDLITTYKPGFNFKVLHVAAIVNTVASTASKTAVLTAAITNTATGVKTNIPGAVLTLTTANMTPVGAVVLAAATDPYPLNQGGPNDTVSLTASGVTAFVEGIATIVLMLQELG